MSGDRNYNQQHNQYSNYYQQWDGQPYIWQQEQVQQQQEYYQQYPQQYQQPQQQQHYQGHDFQQQYWGYDNNQPIYYQNRQQQYLPYPPQFQQNQLLDYQQQQQRHDFQHSTVPTQGLTMNEFWAGQRQLTSAPITHQNRNLSRQERVESFHQDYGWLNGEKLYNYGFTLAIKSDQGMDKLIHEINSSPIKPRVAVFDHVISFNQYEKYFDVDRIACGFDSTYSQFLREVLLDRLNYDRQSFDFQQINRDSYTREFSRDPNSVTTDFVSFVFCLRYRPQQQTEQITRSKMQQFVQAINPAKKYVPYGTPLTRNSQLRRDRLYRSLLKILGGYNREQGYKIIPYKDVYGYYLSDNEPHRQFQKETGLRLDEARGNCADLQLISLFTNGLNVRDNLRDLIREEVGIAVNVGNDWLQKTLKQIQSVVVTLDGGQVYKFDWDSKRYIQHDMNPNTWDELQYQRDQETDALQWQDISHVAITPNQDLIVVEEIQQTPLQWDESQYQGDQETDELQLQDISPVAIIPNENLIVVEEIQQPHLQQQQDNIRPDTVKKLRSKVVVPSEVEAEEQDIPKDPRVIIKQSQQEQIIDKQAPAVDQQAVVRDQQADNVAGASGTQLETVVQQLDFDGDINNEPYYDEELEEQLPDVQQNVEQNDQGKVTDLNSADFRVENRSKDQSAQRDVQRQQDKQQTEEHISKQYPYQQKRTGQQLQNEREQVEHDDEADSQGTQIYREIAEKEPEVQSHVRQQTSQTEREGNQGSVMAKTTKQYSIRSNQKQAESGKQKINLQPDRSTKLTPIDEMKESAYGVYNNMRTDEKQLQVSIEILRRYVRSMKKPVKNSQNQLIFGETVVHIATNESELAYGLYLLKNVAKDKKFGVDVEGVPGKKQKISQGQKRKNKKQNISNEYTEPPSAQLIQISTERFCVIVVLSQFQIKFKDRVGTVKKQEDVKREAEKLLKNQLCTFHQFRKLVDDIQLFYSSESKHQYREQNQFYFPIRLFLFMQEEGHTFYSWGTTRAASDGSNKTEFALDQTFFDEYNIDVKNFFPKSRWYDASGQSRSIKKIPEQLFGFNDDLNQNIKDSQEWMVQNGYGYHIYRLGKNQVYDKFESKEPTESYYGLKPQCVAYSAYDPLATVIAWKFLDVRNRYVNDMMKGKDPENEFQDQDNFDSEDEEQGEDKNKSSTETSQLQDQVNQKLKDRILHLVDNQASYFAIHEDTTVKSDRLMQAIHGTSIDYRTYLQYDVQRDLQTLTRLGDQAEPQVTDVLGSNICVSEAPPSTQISKSLIDLDNIKYVRYPDSNYIDFRIHRDSPPINISKYYLHFMADVIKFSSLLAQLGPKQQQIRDISRKQLGEKYPDVHEEGVSTHELIKAIEKHGIDKINNFRHTRREYELLKQQMRDALQRIKIHKSTPNFVQIIKYWMEYKVLTRCKISSKKAKDFTYQDPENPNMERYAQIQFVQMGPLTSYVVKNKELFYQVMLNKVMQTYEYNVYAVDTNIFEYSKEDQPKIKNYQPQYFMSISTYDTCVIFFGSAPQCLELFDYVAKQMTVQLKSDGKWKCGLLVPAFISLCFANHTTQRTANILSRECRNQFDQDYDYYPKDYGSDDSEFEDKEEEREKNQCYQYADFLIRLGKGHVTFFDTIYEQLFVTTDQKKPAEYQQNLKKLFQAGADNLDRLQFRDLKQDQQDKTQAYLMIRGILQSLIHTIACMQPNNNLQEICFGEINDHFVWTTPSFPSYSLVRVKETDESFNEFYGGDGYLKENIQRRLSQK